MKGDSEKQVSSHETAWECPCMGLVHRQSKSVRPSVLARHVLELMPVFHRQQ